MSSNCDTCPSKGKCTSDKGSCSIENNVNNKVKKVIAVMSGKGGVGKSTMSTMIAKTLRKKGYSVGVLDADITGPSIPRLLNIKETEVFGSEQGILPVASKEDIKVMSINFLINDEESPVILRGPAVSATVKQFWTDVYWGELDYLIIDMPPGTGDVPLTVMQSIPINGVVVVTTPQDMVSMIVAKSINMARKMNVEVLGVIQNMSYLVCPDCNTKIKIFKDEDFKEYIDRMHTKLLGEMPMTLDLAKISDGEVTQYGDKVEETLNEITDEIEKFCK
ncbi:Mrp/NBP35 family ATP-binding protein [Clostridium senegalense]|uniref:Mrp/NBP35 family ATP-binding protein n=1 Tax=Clostridium senegalense TaxID=1465809 RepID=UPI000288FFB3|nr:Mrp/NBP35 family ATP-binding protein [Clostridium senegalense]MBU5226772.1 Mrp/NBP35 family ATP-binding protein [Clostridium senegalense]